MLRSLTTTSQSLRCPKIRFISMKNTGFQRTQKQSPLATMMLHPDSNGRAVTTTLQDRKYTNFSTCTTTTASIPTLRTYPIHSSHNGKLITDQRRTQVFVSRFNKALNVTSQTILDYCGQHIGNIATTDARTTSGHVILKECPFCNKPHHDKPDNLYKLYIQIGGGAYFCHRCGAKGSWYDFKAQFGGYHHMQGGGGGGGGGGQPSFNDVPNDGRAMASRLPGTNGARGTRKGSNGPERNGGVSHNSLSNTSSSIACLPMPQPRLAAYYNTLLLDQGAASGGDNNSNDNSALDGHTNATANDMNENKTVLTYLMKERGLTRSTLRKYGVGRATYKFPTKDKGYVSAECVTFPWIMRASDVAYQEEMRGANFVYESNTADEEDVTPDSLQVEETKSTETSKPKAKGKFKNNETPPAKTDDGPSIPTGKFVTRRIKVRSVSNKSWQRLDPAGGGWGLFGLHTVPDTATEVILTEGEYDAMAVYQATGRPAISLPNGCRSLPPQALSLLERFEKIYLWMDNDAPGHEGAETFSKKLGLARCHIVNCLEAKDANEALLKGVDMNRLLDSARPVPHERIVTFPDLRHQVLHEVLHPDQYRGVPIPSLPGFTKMIKGFRRGELTVLTGPTGSGKTTFLGQLSLDLVEQGINCLWGSFEIKNTRLIHKMLQQFSRKPLPVGKQEMESLIDNPVAMEQLEALADRFEELPIYFMGFHGGSDVDEVLDAMEYAVYVNDVEHIILDNMQFMISRNGLANSKFDKFDVQDMAIEKFRKFATEHNVHVTIVVHPRKEEEAAKLNLSSFYGTAKATQEADTVLILQNDGRRKYMEVKKNRFDGTLGHIPLFFQRKSGRYSEQDGPMTASSPRNSKENFDGSSYVTTAKEKVLEGHWEKSLFKEING